MKPEDALRAARAAGYKVWLDGTGLQVAPEPPADVVIQLSQHAKAIMAILRKERPWRAADWKLYFEEHAEAGEQRGLPRALAELRAFDCTLAHWLHSHPSTSPPGTCAGCAQRQSATDPLIPYGDAKRGLSFLHNACWPDWYRGRKADAIEKLAAMGITRAGLETKPPTAGQHAKSEAGDEQTNHV